MVSDGRLGSVEVETLNYNRRHVERNECGWEGSDSGYLGVVCLAGVKNDDVKSGCACVVFQVEKCSKHKEPTNIPLTLSVRNVTFDTSLPSSLQIFSYEDFSSFGPAFTVS